MQGSLKFVKGDATRPIGEGNKMLLHICNDENRWGAGFVLAVSRRWPEVERVYRASPMNSTLGANIVVEVAPNLNVVKYDSPTRNWQVTRWNATNKVLGS